MAEWWYNTSYHSSAGMTPYQALYNQAPPSINYQMAGCEDPVVNQFLKDRIRTLTLLKDNLNKAQERMKIFADKKRSDREFDIGDEVYLKRQPYRQTSVAMRKNQKLSARYYGPYPVIGRTGKVAHQLQLPRSAKIHNTFHVSQLKKKLGTKKVVQEELPAIAENGELNPIPVKILERKMIKKGNAPAVQVLVQWDQEDQAGATWESWDTMKKNYPDFVNNS